MTNRRQIIRNTIALCLTAAFGLMSNAVISANAETQTPEGFHHQDWFQKTTFDLRKDLANAAKNNKNLVLLWEQTGCIYCSKMHANIFTKPDIVKLIIENFEVVQMNMRGSRKFIGLNGAETTEAEIARYLTVNATPTTMFLNTKGEITFRAPGYLKPIFFKAIYQYVIDKAYEKAPFLTWIKTHKFS